LLWGLQWVITGGESGPNARPCHLSWMMSIVKQCREYRVPVFVKQMGGNIPDGDQDYIQRVTGQSVHNRKGGDMDEFPPELRVREFPGGGA
jgi:protein gp37